MSKATGGQDHQAVASGSSEYALVCRADGQHSNGKLLLRNSDTRELKDSPLSRAIGLDDRGLTTIDGFGRWPAINR